MSQTLQNDAHLANDRKNNGHLCFRGRCTKADLAELAEKLSNSMGDRWRNMIQQIVCIRASIKRRMLQLLRFMRRPGQAVIDEFKSTLNRVRSYQLARKVSRKNTVPDPPVRIAGDSRQQAVASLNVAEKALSAPGASVDWAIKHAITGQSMEGPSSTKVDELQKLMGTVDDCYSLWDNLSSDERLVIFRENPRTWDGRKSAAGRSKLGLYILLCDYHWIYGKDPWPILRQSLGYSTYPREWKYNHIGYSACERQQCRCPKYKRAFFGEYCDLVKSVGNVAELYYGRLMGQHL